MKKIMSAIALLFAGFQSGIAFSEEYNINPGMWETTLEMEIKGMPPEMAAMMQRPPKVEKECVKDRNYDFNPEDNASGCTFNKKRHSDRKLTWDISCDAKGGNAKGQGEANFNGDTVSGWFEMNMQGPGGPMKMRHTFNGKRLGSC